MIEAAILCLALNIYHESRGEPIDGQFAVAQVTLNRAKRKPENVCKVVNAHSQFSWTLTRPPVTDKLAFDHAMRVARLSLEMADFTHNSDHFHSIAVSPSWAKRMEVTGYWGNHIFYRSR